MDLVPAVLFPLCWWALGAALADRLSLADRLLGRFLFPAALGATIHSTWIAVTLLLRVPPLASTIVFLAAGLVLAGCRRGEIGEAARWVRTEVARSTLLTKLGALALFGVLALMLAKSFAPPSSFDALCYHLPEVEKYHDTASLEPIPHLNQTFFPKALESLYVSAYALGSLAAAQIVHAWLGILLVLGIAAICRRLLGQARWGVLGGLVFLSVRDVTYEFGTANVDLGYALFQVVAVSQLLRFVERRSIRDAASCGWFGGMAVAAKLLGAGLVAITCVLIPLAVIRRDGIKRALLGTAVCGLTALIAYAPWFVRGEMHLGTALYPVKPAAVTSHGMPVPAGDTTVGSELADADRIYPLRGTSVFLSLVTVTWYQSKFKSPLTPIYLAFVPLGLLWILAGRRKRAALLLCFVALLAWAFWFKTYPIVRYVLAPLGILTVAVVAGMQFLRRAAWPWRVLAMACLAIPMVLSLAKAGLDGAFALPAAVSEKHEAAYLGRRVNSWPLAAKFRPHIDGRVLSSDPRGQILGRDTEQAGGWNLYWTGPETVESFRDWLTARRIDYVAYFAAKAGQMDPELLRKATAAGVLEVVLEEKAGALYRVRRSDAGESER